jgi:hypothetical protein
MDVEQAAWDGLLDLHLQDKCCQCHYLLSDPRCKCSLEEGECTMTKYVRVEQDKHGRPKYFPYWYGWDCFGQLRQQGYDERTKDRLLKYGLPSRHPLTNKPWEATKISTMPMDLFEELCRWARHTKEAADCKGKELPWLPYEVGCYLLGLPGDTKLEELGEPPASCPPECVWEREGPKRSLPPPPPRQEARAKMKQQHQAGERGHGAGRVRDGFGQDGRSRDDRERATTAVDKTAPGEGKSGKRARTVSPSRSEPAAADDPKPAVGDTKGAEKRTAVERVQVPSGYKFLRVPEDQLEKVNTAREHLGAMNREVQDLGRAAEQACAKRDTAKVGLDKAVQEFQALSAALTTFLYYQSPITPGGKEEDTEPETHDDVSE